VLASTAFAQGAVISGTVKSAQGQNLQAANIRIPDLNVSVGTGEDGTYRITLSAERIRGQTANMTVRAIGFRPQTKSLTINAGNQTHDFVLEVDVNRLSEVVVTGVTGATGVTGQGGIRTLARLRLLRSVPDPGQPPRARPPTAELGRAHPP